MLSVKEGADRELEILDNQSNMLKLEPDFAEEQEADTSLPTKRGRGCPIGSRVQNCQENFNGELLFNPSNMVDVGPEYGEAEEADTLVSQQKERGQPRGSMMPDCQESADGNFHIDSTPSAMMEVNPGCNEEQGADAGSMPKKRGRGRPRVSANHENDQQNADDISVKPRRKGRGRTRGLTLQMKRQQSADGKLDVVIHPTKLVAVGPGRKDFITDLSVIVRQNARLNVHKWKLVPKSTRDTIVQKILKNWRLPDTDMVRKAILDEAARLYRNWRNRLHDHYLMFETKEEALKHVPDEINGSDWPILVDYFSSPAFEIMSAKNKENRAKLLTNHTCGTRSFHAVSYDARDEVTGKEPDLKTLWQLTHKKSNGEWVDEASKAVHDKVAEQINENLHQLECSSDGMETIEPEMINNAFKTVIGRKSYMQGFGAGVRSSSSIRIQLLQAELEAQKRETENARKECNQTRARLVEVESQLEAERQNREAELEAQKRETENARKECNETRARLVEVESQLEAERQKREEIETRQRDRQKEMQEINSQVQSAIQSALSQFRPQGTEEETASRQKSKIVELEAQLHEAEDVITDLRSELRRYGWR